MRHQVEWQLWAAVVENFADPNYHMAYLSLVSRHLLFAEAVKRYQTHSKVMGMLADSQWQSEICDRQLNTIQTIALLQCERVLQRPEKQFLFPRSLTLALALVAGLIFIVHVF
jgi:hypothetical protein